MFEGMPMSLEILRRSHMLVCDDCKDEQNQEQEYADRAGISEFAVVKRGVVDIVAWHHTRITVSYTHLPSENPAY